MPEELLDQIAALARRSKSTVYVVGGYLRDHLLGREPLDLDLLVEGSITPFLEALSKKAGFEPVVFSRREPVTYRVAMDDWLIDVSACRHRGLTEALRRRDFSINALAARIVGSPASGGSRLDEPIDPVGGLADLKAGRIRHVSARGLEEDPVRLLRAVRLGAVLEGFALDPALVAELELKAPLIESAPAERVMAEMEMILASPHAGRALRLMSRSGLLLRILPELAPLQGLAQNRWHRYDVFEHTLHCVEEADGLQTRGDAVGLEEPLGVEDAEILKWAALLHDTGKADTATTGADGAVHFFGHEMESARIASAALGRLRAGARKTARVRALVASHLRLTLLSATGSVSDKALRRLVHEVRHDTSLLCLLALADRRAGGGPDFERRYEALRSLVARVMETVRTEGDAVISPTPLLSGHEVMEILALPPGPRVGAVLRWLTKMQVEENLSRHDEAVKLLRSLPQSKVLTLEDEV